MNSLNRKKSIVLYLLLVMLLVPGLPVAAGTQKHSDVTLRIPNLETQPRIAGIVYGTGTDFEVTNSDYLNIMLTSSEPLKLTLESVPKMIMMGIAAAEKATSAKITLSGFLPSTTYYKYEDNYHNIAIFTTDTNGSYSYEQDLTRPHLVFIQPQPSTKFVPGDTTIGTWNPATRTYTLSADVNETIQIDEDNLTLHGAGHTIIGTGSGCGIYLYERAGVTVRNVNVEDFSYGIHLYNSTNNTVTDNTSSWNSRYGIYLLNSNGNTVTDNTAENNHEAIFLRYSSNNTLTANITSNNYSGIYLYADCNNNTLTGNTASKNSHGIYLYDSNGNNLIGNTANSNDYYGICLYNNCNSVLVDNAASWNHSHGIYLYNSNDNTLLGNTVSHNYPGIYFYYNCSNNTLTTNTISDNYYGIFFYYNCNNNEIYNNNFINNKTQAYVHSGSGNVFNFAPPTGGNYWSDWTSPDADRDGLVDDEYVFTSGQDVFPWVRQNAWNNLAPIADAGTDQMAHPVEVVTLDGSDSSDPEGDYPLTYSWKIVTKPEGSAAVLSDVAAVGPSFTVDKLGDYIVELVVTDTLGAQSATDQVAVGTYNAEPVADAGPDQTLHPREMVILDGSASSDIESDYPLSYSWQFTSKPAGSVAELIGADTASPSFTLDNMMGEYIIELIVTDCLGAVSIADVVTINTSNEIPTANAGPDQMAHPVEVVTLDGSDSSDPDGDYPLTYSWQIVTKPEGSAAVLSDAAAVGPSFTVDKLGDYIVELVVTDTLGAHSAADQVAVSTYNAEPVANAGTDQSIILLGSTVELNGNGSSDQDGDQITYAWTITHKPAGSTAELSDPASATPSFVADVHSDYVISLIVTDVLGAVSVPDSVTVSFQNIKPVADAGANQSAIAGDTISLDASASTDGNGDALTYNWSFASKPAGSVADFTDPALIQTSFVADEAGTYVVRLVVNDGFVDSDAANVTITAITAQQAAINVLLEAMDVIRGLDPAVLKDGNVTSDSLINKIDAAIKMIEKGNYSTVIGKLQNDIIEHTNGCAVGGGPDSNDWILDCQAQGQVYPLVIEALELLQRLI